MKVTKKTSGKVYEAEMVPNRCKDEGGLWKTTDPEFLYRNGQQFHETYMMGEVKIVQPKPKPAAPEPTPPKVVAPNFAKEATFINKALSKTAPDDGVTDEIEVNFDPLTANEIKEALEKKLERKVELPAPKKKKAKKKGRGRFGKGRRADESQERSGDTL